MSKKSMKNLFLQSLRSKQVGIGVLSVLVFVAVLTFVLYEGTKETVALSIDGNEKEIRTHADTVQQLLDEENIQLSEADQITPSLNTSIKDGLAIKWEQATTKTILVDGQEQSIDTTKDQVQAILEEANISISEHDKVTPALNAEIGPDAKIEVQKAFPIVLKDGTKEQKVWSTSTTVADFLKQQQIKLNEFDRVEQNLEDEVQPNDVVQIVRVEKVTDVVEAATNFAVERKKDSNLLKGQEKVVQAGQKGKIARTYEIIKENGKPVSRILKNEKVVAEPSKKVVAVGTKVMTASVGRSNEPTGGREFYVTATAYTAFCNGCSGITATGIDLRANTSAKVIAVDPSVIPLGSKVWIEGFGYAIAGDTGGAIKGNRIDIFMPTKGQAFNYGRRTVKIKIIN